MVLDRPIKTLGVQPVRLALHPEVIVQVSLNVARSQDEAERQARGEDVTVVKDEAVPLETFKPDHALCFNGTHAFYRVFFTLCRDLGIPVICGGTLLICNPVTPTQLPSYWRFDTFLEGYVAKNYEWKVFVNNITNKTYYDGFYQSGAPFVLQAPGRAIGGQLTARF